MTEGDTGEADQKKRWPYKSTPKPCTWDGKKQFYSDRVLCACLLGELLRSGANVGHSKRDQQTERQKNSNQTKRSSPALLGLGPRKPTKLEVRSDRLGPK